MDFEYSRLTKNGIKAAALALSGEEIEFTKIVMGSGDPEPGVSYDDLEAVVDPRVNIDITRRELANDSIAVLGGVFSNNVQHGGFKFKELGLYVRMPTGEEVLYSYAHASDDHCSVIPASGTPTFVEMNIDIRTTVGNTAQMRVYVNPDAYPTMRDFEELLEIVAAIRVTATGAVVVAEEAKRIAEEAMRIVQACDDRLDAFEGRLKSVEVAMFENVTSNPFSITFEDLVNINLTSGVHNKERARLECSKVVA